MMNKREKKRSEISIYTGKEIDKFAEIKVLVNKPKSPCNVCCNSSGNQEAYMCSQDGFQKSCGWVDCYTCKGTGLIPNNDEILKSIKEICNED